MIGEHLGQDQGARRRWSIRSRYGRSDRQRARPLVLGDRPRAAAAGRGADRDRADRGRRRLAGRGAALFGRQRQLRRRSIISSASWSGSRSALPVMIGISMLPRERGAAAVAARRGVLRRAADPRADHRVEVNGARRWLERRLRQFQPSEFLKPLFVVAWPGCCRCASRTQSLPVFAAVGAAHRR